MFRSNSVLNVCTRKLDDGQINVNFEIVRRDGEKLFFDSKGSDLVRMLHDMANNPRQLIFKFDFPNKSDDARITKGRFLDIQNNDSGVILKDTWRYVMTIKSGERNIEATATFTQEEMLDLLKELDIK